MRKVILSMQMTLDGFIEGLGGGTDWSWHVWDEEMEKYADELIDSADVLLFGRVAYQLLADYWQAATGEFAEKMNRIPKIVFSGTLRKTDWNARLVKENIAEEISKAKQQSGKDLVLLAGADIASTFMKLGLIDEYRIIVNPVVLGSGKPLFKDIRGRMNLKLSKTKTFKCGNLMLYYQPIQKDGD